jgi:hypothetical protein
VRDWKDNLLPTVRSEEIEGDFRAGGGHELDEKFCAAYSSSALAANCFGPFRVQKEGRETPPIAGSGAMRLSFEHPLPHGLPRPPFLDVVARGIDTLVAIESKSLEFLSSHRGKFSPAYQRIEKNLEDGWRRVYELVHADAKCFGGLDAAQLVKHYLGIRYSASEYRNKVLLYLYWEPLNAQSIKAFVKHRENIEKFSKRVKGSEVKFLSQSYPELFESWSNVPSPEVRDHVNRLKERYLIPLR